MIMQPYRYMRKNSATEAISAISCSTLSLSSLLLLYSCHFIITAYATESNDNVDDSATFFVDQTCTSVTPSSLGYNYGLFGNSSYSYALNKVSGWQLPASVGILEAVNSESSAACVFGVCDFTTSSCKCSRNFVGTRCQNCASRVLWSDPEGVIASNAPPSYAKNSRCTWIISAPNVKPDKQYLSIKLLNFSSECSWDSLFIFDGVSANESNLLAVVSGDYSVDRISHFHSFYPKSGSALLYFYSDAHLQYGGFTLEYSFSYCPRDCSGHGRCVGGPADMSVVTVSINGTMSVDSTSKTSTAKQVESPLCLCDAGFSGDACEYLQCLNDCSFPNGTCQKDGTCICKPMHAGPDCSVSIERIPYYFDNLPIQSMRFVDDVVVPGASGASVLIDSVVWIFGGFNFDSLFGPIIIRKFDLSTHSFMESVVPTNLVYNRYGLTGHHSQCNPDLVYLFGGTLTASNRISSELIAYNINSRSFKVINHALARSNWPHRTDAAALSGHSSHLLCDLDTGVERLYVFFGYSPDYGLSDWLRIWNFSSSTWSVEQSPFHGRAWHSSVFDSTTNSVFVYGGFANSHSRWSADITGDLLRYELSTSRWVKIGQLPQQRAFHSMTMLPFGERQLLVFGGTMHEATISTGDSSHDICYISRPLVFDLESGCSALLHHEILTNMNFSSSDSEYRPTPIARIGHSAIVHGNSVKFFGGFDGTITGLSVVEFTATHCESRLSATDCLTLNGFSCKWACERCHSLKSEVVACNSTILAPTNCVSKLNTSSVVERVSAPRRCVEKSSCMSCTSFKPQLESAESNQSDSFWCVWFPDKACVPLTAKDASKTTTESPIFDSKLTVSSSQAAVSQGQRVISQPEACAASCYSLLNCSSCTLSGCLWCNSLALCLPSDAYRIAFPYGQCQDWTMDVETCRTNCSVYRSCSDCQQDHRCGWCDDGSGSGIGNCMQGGLDSAVNDSEANECPNERWYFGTCPACQCSGHSTCVNGSSVCLDCQHNTKGDKCEYCASGYFGNALNGGICKPCDCNGHGTMCDPHSGRCKCDTQGVIGEQCDRCDKLYEGDALYGTCYYPIQTGYRYTMDLTKKEMEHINKINFETKDKLGRNEVNFKLNCSRLANYKLSYTTGEAVNSTDTVYQSGLCGPDYPQVEISISTTSGVPFSEDYFRFRISITNFTHPFLITLVATEEQPFLIYLLLIAVFGCFLVVLVIAIIVFQIKRRYDEYHRRQQVKTELRRMAKRPFAMVNFQLMPQLSSSRQSTESQPLISDNSPAVSAQPRAAVKAVHLQQSIPPMPRSSPMPVTLQPLAVPGAAVMTVLIQLPLVANRKSDNNVKAPQEIGAPSAIATGSVIVRAASSLLADLSNCNKPNNSTPTTLGGVVTTEMDLCAMGGTYSSTNNSRPVVGFSATGPHPASNNVQTNHDPATSPMLASASRRSSRQTCWNTPPGTVNSRPSNARIASAPSHGRNANLTMEQQQHLSEITISTKDKSKHLSPTTGDMRSATVIGSISNDASKPGSHDASF